METMNWNAVNDPYRVQVDHHQYLVDRILSRTPRHIKAGISAIIERHGGFEYGAGDGGKNDVDNACNYVWGGIDIESDPNEPHPTVNGFNDDERQELARRAKEIKAYCERMPIINRAVLFICCGKRGSGWTGIQLPPEVNEDLMEVMPILVQNERRREKRRQRIQAAIWKKENCIL